MAIAFNCPHCQFAYKLPDKLAGKQAKCKNTECRKVITIPAPMTIPDDAAELDAAAAEAAALAALTDEGPKKEETPPEEKVIPMTCSFCDHKWTVPWAMAGKNVLCPNPECRQRQRVPEPKEDVPYDWRQTKSKLPSMAKDAQPKIEGEVVAASEAKLVSGEALKEAGAIEEEIEPRPLKQKIMFGVIGVGLLAGLILGVMSWRSSIVDNREVRLMADARKAFDEAAPTMTPADAALSSALLHAAEAEYALRKEDPDLKAAHELFAKGRTEAMRQPPGLARSAVAAELALAVLEFGGTDEQVKEQLRFPWTPDTTSGRLPRINERVHTVFEELTTTCQLFQPLVPSESDFRVTLARRLTRELARRGQAQLAADLLPLALFTDAEKADARATIALEIYRADRNSAVPPKVAEELKAAFTGKGASGAPGSAQALWEVLNTPKAPPFPKPPVGNSAIGDATRQAYTALRLLEGNTADALKAAQHPGQPDSQFRALLLVAEWSDPSAAGPAFDAAQQIMGGKSRQAASQILRFSALAAAAGRHEQAKAFADALPDDALKAWARGDAARMRTAANPKDKADESWVEVPDAAKNQHPGHAWGRLWIVRQNAKLSHDREAEKKTLASWPTAVTPFGYAGIALGLQDPQP